MPQEVIADGPNGPLVLRNGQWVPFTQAPAASPTIITKRADPKTPYEIAKLQSETDPTTLKAQRDKAVADAQKARAEADAAVAKVGKGSSTPANLLANDELLTTIARARQHLTANSAATGGYSYLSSLPGTEAKQLKNLIDTIRANVSFDRLQQMRNESPTGGAVGNASDNDMKLLGSTTAALDQSANAADLSKSLDAIERRYLGLRADMLGQPRDKFTADYYAATQPKKQEVAPSPIALPPAPGGGGPGPTAGPGPLGPNGGASGGDGSGAPTIDLQYKEVPNEAGQKYWAAIAPMFKAGASDAEIEAASVALGAPKNFLAQNFADRKKYGPRFNAVPGEGLMTTKVPLSVPEKIVNTFVADPTVTAITHAGDKLGAGIPFALASRIGGDNVTAGLNAQRNTNPIASAVGDFTGTGAGAFAAELGALRGLTSFGVGAENAARWAPRLGDLAYGGAAGATGDPEHPGWGAAKGAALSYAGGVAGRTVGGAMARPYRPNAADTEIGGAINNAGPDLVGNTLREGQSLGLPMALADTAPQLGSIAGAAVRRSPNAASIARSVLRPRNLAQIDRLGTAVERDLGPIGNVPQISQDLQKSASANAGPLYKSAYPQTVNDPSINELLANPQLGDAVNSARMFREQDATLARARGLPEPPPLAEPGGPIDIQTIDYMKRGLDGRINTAFAGGDPQAAMSGPFLKQARGLMLKAADEQVPDYAAARAAYSGPMRAQEALDMGTGAVQPNVTANQLGVDLAGVEPGNIPQAQLGYRSGMMDKANKNRFNANPFETALGTPDAVSKLETMYPGNIGNNTLLRQRDLERQMQETSNRLLGGSATAENTIADNAFKGDPLGNVVGAGMDIATGVPTNTALNAGRFGIKKLFGARADAKAVAKADAVAPILLNPNADESLAELARILGGMQRYNRVAGVTRPVGSIAGVGAGLSLPSVYGN